MNDLLHNQQLPHELGGSVRLQTMITLRWLAIVGQSLIIFYVHYILGFPLMIGFCFAIINTSVWLNIFITLKYTSKGSLSQNEAAGHLLFDTLQLAALLFLNGGLQNPFAVLFLIPVTIGATVLSSTRFRIILAVILLTVTILSQLHYPLPWYPEKPIHLPPLFITGTWLALMIGIGFAISYARRIALENRHMNTALAISQMVIAREQKLASLDGLAAAAAHELGTPLTTIQITAREMVETVPKTDPLWHDIEVLLTQSQHCRDILKRLVTQDKSDISPSPITLQAMLEEAAAPFSRHMPDQHVTITFDVKPEQVDRKFKYLAKHPEILYGMRALIENAVRHAKNNVIIMSCWDDIKLTVTVLDDGEGFSQNQLLRLGEPFLTQTSSGKDHATGLGLGFFIAKTLLERTGATVQHGNRAASPKEGNPKGAWVRIAWPLALNTNINYVKSRAE